MKKTKYIFIFIFFTLTAFIQCTNKQTELSFYDEFIIKSAKDTSLKLQLARLNDRCGEWGGDLEWIIISQKSNGEIWAEYFFENRCESDFNLPFPSYKYRNKKTTPKIKKILINVIKNLSDVKIEREPETIKLKDLLFFNNYSQVLFSDSSRIIQGSQNYSWELFDSLVVHLKTN